VLRRCCLHNAQSKQQSSSSYKRDSVTFLSKTSTTTTWLAPSNDITFARLHTSNIRSNDLFIDGASDEVGGCSVGIASQHQQRHCLLFHSWSVQLPNCPIQQVQASCHSRAPKIQTNRPSTASSISPGRSRSSSKMDTTRGLINPDMAGRNTKLCPVDPDMYLNPTKYDPGNPPKSPKT
jgi:hypothetical protein